MPTHQASLLISSSHRALAGHFPGRPIVPGVVLLDCVLAEAEAWLGHALGVQGVSHAKFTAPLLPEQSACMRLQIAGDELRFTITRDHELIAQGAFSLRESPTDRHPTATKASSNLALQAGANLSMSGKSINQGLPERQTADAPQVEVPDALLSPTENLPQKRHDAAGMERTRERPA